METTQEMLPAADTPQPGSGELSAELVSGKKLAAIMSLYLLGIFMGAIDTGIVTPARTVIQNNLGVDDKSGVWIITIYTLAYAASIPVMGKLADRLGRKPIYLLSIALFGIGSLMCGLSQSLDSFSFLILARAIQAIGGGGILPIATAEFGTEVPLEKRGMALGLVGAVYGVANIFGASAGSLILDVFGKDQWALIFYVNIPISVAIIAAGLFVLPNNRGSSVNRIDVLGILVLVTMIMSLLYGLKNVDFFNFGSTVTSTSVYPFLLLFVVLLPVLILVERRAQDPVLNLRYFTSRPLLVTMLVAMVSGIILIGSVFVPQFAENALKVPSGSGGYFVIILGLFSGVGAPLSGRLTDMFGPKKVLGFGLLVSAIGSLVVVFYSIPSPSTFSVSLALALLGLGLGFTIGTPLNYMMLEHTPKEESNSALATLSLVRSIGTTLAPAIMVGFLAQAGTSLQPTLTALLPQQIAAPTLPYAQELSDKFAALKADPDFADKLGDVQFPDIASQTTITINMDDSASGEGLSDDLIQLLQDSDVTTITSTTKIVAQTMFDKNTPEVIADITNGVQTGIDQISGVLPELDEAIAKTGEGINGIDKAISGITAATNGIKQGIAGITAGITSTGKAIDGMTAALSGMESGLAGMESGLADMDNALDGVASAEAGAQAGIDGSTAGLAEIDAAIAEMTAASVQMQASLDQLNATIATQQALLAELQAIQPNFAADVAAGNSLPDLLSDEVRASLSAEQLASMEQVTTPEQLQELINSTSSNLIALTQQRDEMSASLATLQSTLTDLGNSRAELAAERDSLIGMLAGLQSQRTQLTEARAALEAQADALQQQASDLAAQRAALEAARANLIAQQTQLRIELSTLQRKLAQTRSARGELIEARASIIAARADLLETVRQMQVLRDAVPGAFETAKQDYLAQIDALSPQLETAFQQTLNRGFRDIYIATAVTCILGSGLLTMYPRRRREEPAA